MTEELSEELKQEIQQAQYEERVDETERLNSGTSWTRNSSFDANGYLPYENICDPKDLYSELPSEKGMYHYFGKEIDQFNHRPEDPQVKGATARYWYPPYRKLHTQIRKKVEKVIGRELYNTYYYDRFYFPDQKLKRHIDRDACEISVSVHIGTNIEGEESEWPFHIKTPDTYEDEKKKKILAQGEVHSLTMGPGDGVIYKGCERPHWREPLKVSNPKEGVEYYYHQIFFHYVLQDGLRCQCANDL